MKNVVIQWSTLFGLVTVFHSCTPNVYYRALYSTNNSTLIANAPRVFDASTSFNFQVNTNKVGSGLTSNSKQFNLNLVPGAHYDFIVDWGDGSQSTITSDSDTAQLHTYTAAGTYLVRISGEIDHLRFSIYDSNLGDYVGDAEKVLNVTQWGTNQWLSMREMFANAFNLTGFSASDSPDLSRVTDMSYMFYYASLFNGNIGTWNTASVTNMSSMFDHDTSFNQNIGTWNTTSVTNMNSMFKAASAFNQNIGTWNTASVIDMSYMFNLAIAFNQNIGTWNTTSVTNMNSMFKAASVFNQNIGTWNTASVTNMSSMFYSASAFNQNLSTWSVAAVGTNYSSYRSGATSWVLPKPSGFP
jgi:surface protein